MFWRFDYMVKSRTNYMTTTRLSSTRTVGSEAGNGAGEFNYYSGNGTNYIFVTGKEYNADYFKHFNNRQFPGITAEQDNEKLPIPNWGENATGGSSFAGGVSDSTYGACAMKLQRRGLSAHKAWFYFDDEFVCLGAGINEDNGKAAVYTTMNQCNVSSSTQYSVKGKIADLKSTVTLSALDWILQGKIGYFNLDPTASILLSETNKLFSANIDHGINPKNKSYAYIVKPDLSSAKEAADYLSKNPIQVLSNNDKVQAVRNKNLNLTQVIFYEAGTLVVEKGKSITVDAPCAILLNDKSDKISLSNPNCESNNTVAVHVVLKLKNKSTMLDFQLPTGVKSGSSVCKFL
jgi:chondroitin AC lyase